MRLNGYLMSKDIPVAGFIERDINVLDEHLLPLYFKNFYSIEDWLEIRAIDRHRTNSRLLKKALRLTTADDVEVVLKVNGATITDTYWFKPFDSGLRYDDIKFKGNLFDKLALYGDPDSFNIGYRDTPELTNIGSFEKCWRLIDGEWWLYKQGNGLEIFSELFICEFGKALGLSMAHYEKDGKYIRSLDFTKGASVNLELAYGLVGEEEDYDINYLKMKELSEKCAMEYIEMIFLDTICFNMDRHTKNYGILREVDTGTVIGMAPNYDNNVALISRGYPKKTDRKNDRLIELFIDFLEKNDVARKCFLNMDIPKIDNELIGKVIDKIRMKVDRDFICTYIINGYKRIQGEMKENEIKVCK
jgi:hypothetical protein